MSSPPEEIHEQSAGCVLVRLVDDQALPHWEALVIRFRREGYELPKGHVDTGETLSQAAARELHEETGLASPIQVGRHLATLEYDFLRGGTRIRKTVSYYLATPDGTDLTFGDLPDGTRERRWVSASEAASIPLLKEQLRPVLLSAFPNEP